jgi:cytochrome o ubiquinol oxidase subunit 1
MYGGRVRFTTPMMWSLGFMTLFIIGGVTGVLLAIPPADFVVHNSLFLVAHFHNAIIPGVVFAIFAAYTYWFPKAFGFTLDESWGKAAFWLWFVGFLLAFMPLYVLGLEGMPRRLQSYDVPQWHVWTLIALLGSLTIFAGVACQAIQLIVSIRTRGKRRDVFGDPWDARTLEWLTPSPPPEFNFAVLPDVTGEEPYWGLKEAARAHQQVMRPVPEYEDIEMPRNSPTGFVCAFFAVVMGFSLIWHIWWLLALGFVGAYATVVVFAWRDVHEHVIPAQEVARIDEENRAARNRTLQEGLA